MNYKISIGLEMRNVFLFAMIAHASLIVVVVRTFVVRQFHFFLPPPSPPYIFRQMHVLSPHTHCSGYSQSIFQLDSRISTAVAAALLVFLVDVSYLLYVWIMFVSRVVFRSSIGGDGGQFKRVRYVKLKIKYETLSISRSERAKERERKLLWSG